MDGGELIIEEEELVQDGGVVKTKAALYEEVKDRLVAKVANSLGFPNFFKRYTAGEGSRGTVSFPLSRV